MFQYCLLKYYLYVKSLYIGIDISNIITIIAINVQLTHQQMNISIFKIHIIGNDEF